MWRQVIHLICILIVPKHMIPVLHNGIMYASYTHLFYTVTFEHWYHWLYVCSCVSEKESREMSNALLLTNPARKWIPLGTVWNVTTGQGELCMSFWRSHIKQIWEVKMRQERCFVASELVTTTLYFWLVLDESWKKIKIQIFRKWKPSATLDNIVQCAVANTPAVLRFSSLVLGQQSRIWTLR